VGVCVVVGVRVGVEVEVAGGVGVARASGPRSHAESKSARLMNRHLIFIIFTCRSTY
jgi:hypothetical protein